MSDLAVPTLAQVQRITAEVLRRPEFADLAAGGPRRPGWLERLLAWLASRGPLSLELPVGVLALEILRYALLGTLVFFLVRWIIRQSGGWRPGERAVRAAGLGPAESMLRGEREEELGESLRRAERALAAGDSREAISILCRAALRLLAGQGFLQLKRWKTNLTYLRECPQEAPARSLLGELTSAYSTIVYAHAPYERERIGRLLAELRAQGGLA